MTNISSPMPNMTLYELLDSFGFDAWKTITEQIALPILNLFGLILCSISTFIFFQMRKFQDPIFVYYRILCLLYCFSCLENIPMGVLFSARYFPHMNTYASTVYQIVYAFIGNLIFHYQELLQIAILLTRMAIFDTFLETKFKPYSPKLVSLLLFIVSFVINLSAAFSSTIVVLGEYVYYDAKTNVKQRGIIYDFVNSEFVDSKLGSLVLGFTYFILNVTCTLFVGIVLNIVSFVQYKLYLRKRRLELMRRNPNRLNLTPAEEHREKMDRTVERNMLYMIITLVSMSIFSRCIFILGSIYFLYFANTYANNLVVRVACYFVYSIVPTVSFFIFYLFNRIFRDEFHSLIWSRIKC